jgi:ATP phosphoribosyltransferase regulatory subunit
MALEHPLPSGMRDLLPEEAALRRALGRALLDRFALFGYAPVAPPPFEFADVLERGLGALDPTEVLRFVEPESGEIAALRPDMTPQIARMIATRLADRPPPLRLAYEGTVLRRRGGRARPRRQIPQAGVELAGAPGLAGDLEVLEVLASALEGAGLATFTIDLSDSGIVRGLLEDAPEPARAAIFAALARRDEAALVEAARVHGTDGDRLVRLLRLELATMSFRGTGAADAVEQARRVVVGTPATLAVDRLGVLVARATERGLGPRLSLDFCEVRGFAYYTSTLFHVYAPGPGYAVAAGGRYDDLLARFGAPMPAVGFAVDLDALSAALLHAGVATSTGTPRVITCDARLAAQLRAAHVPCALHADESTLPAHAAAWGYDRVVRTEADVHEVLRVAGSLG